MSKVGGLSVSKAVHVLYLVTVVLLSAGSIAAWFVLPTWANMIIGLVVYTVPIMFRAARAHLQKGKGNPDVDQVNSLDSGTSSNRQEQ